MGRDECGGEFKERVVRNPNIDVDARQLAKLIESAPAAFAKAREGVLAVDWSGVADRLKASSGEQPPMRQPAPSHEDG